jgi:hypothetical protein
MNEAIVLKAKKEWDAGNYDLAGKILFGSLGIYQSAIWALKVLNFVSGYVGEIPKEIEDLLKLEEEKTEWRSAKKCFEKIRENLVLKMEKEGKAVPSFYFLAEHTAQVVFNSTNPEGGFDYHSGWNIPKSAYLCGKQTSDNAYGEKLWKVLSTVPST